MVKAFKALVQHYDTLRLNLDGNSLKFNELILFREVIVEIIEIGDSDELPVVCQEMRAEVNVRLGYPFKVAIIQQEGHADRLFITMHHLVIDGISWRILLESFYQVYNQLLDNLAVELPPKTASLKDWSETINAHAETTKAQNEREYWSKVDQQSFMVRTDYETEDWSVRNLAKESITLSIRQSQYLLSQAIRKLNVDIQAIFNTALLLTLKEFNGTNHAKVELENHGRHLAGVDTSRSIGWFTSMFPFQVSLLEEGDMLDQIKHVHECLQSIPNHGIGYGIHKFLLKTLNNSGNAMSEVRFNYLGQFGAELNNELFNYSLEDHGGESHPDNHITAKLEFNLMVINQELLITLNYNKEAYHESTIQSILNVFQLYLIEIIEVAQEQHSSISTEFEFANLEDDDLKALFD
ncbi:MAG: condensation domain-containing protein [Bacteroidota bacterium]